MGRRWLYSALIVVIVVVGAASTFGATRVWSESRAHGQYQSAQTRAHQALASARRQGLTRTELAPVSRAIAHLDAARPPQSLPVFGSERSDFYQRQSKSYEAAQVRVRTIVTRVTQLTRHSAAAALTAFSGDIARAQVLGLDTASAGSAQSRERERYGHASTVGQFRSVIAAIDAADGTLRSAITARQAAVNNVLQAAHNSLPALDASARTSVSALQPSLALLTLVNRRGQADQTALQAKLNAVTGTSDTTQAAVRMLNLNDAINAAKQDVSSLLPGKMIVVSTEAQSATMYENGTQVYQTPVTTGGPELPTDHGVFHIYMKAPNFTFHSPWPIGSPYYYAPTFVQYWMPFYGGEGLHDASWRSNFGPGSNLQPTDLGTGNYILGTHGCVNLPTPAAAWVWNWAPVGTTVVVI
jgi:lipoprotein-anchoring transpeptidase ErfK/SrfK